MPLELSSIAIEEKNKIARESQFVICLMITIPGLGTPIRIVRDNQDLAWAGQTWTAFPFELDEVGDTDKGEVPQVVIRVSNVSRAMESYIAAYDAWCKNNGYAPIVVNIYVVNTAAVQGNPSIAPEVEHIFELIKPSSGPQWVTFTLGASNPFNRRFPWPRMHRNICRYRQFKGTRCGYVGAEETCDRTLTRCRELENSSRFGGFPGMGQGGLRVA